MFGRLSKLCALLCSGGFSVGLLLTSIVIVESWADLEPAAAVDWFAEFGLPLGFVMVPFGGLAALFSVIGLLISLPGNGTRLAKQSWLAASALTIATMVLLPVYFWEANTLFFDGAIEPGDVADEIQRWKFWNWVRTFLSIFATIAIFIALVSERIADR